MKTPVQILLLSIHLLAFLPARGAELQTFIGAVLAEPVSGDGDSFRVKFDDRTVTIRLYFVDCPETSVGNPTDARRVRAQSRYFGLSGAKETIRFGREAAAFTREQLAKPFTLYTSFAAAPGRSVGGRQYGFVRTASGEYLADLLVERGLARSYGVRRGTPEGVLLAEREAQLDDKESAAMLKRCGIWAATDAERLVELRAAARQEDAELKAFSDAAQETLETVNINTASIEELMLLPGVGEITALRIISGRPYGAIADLLKVTGIGPRTAKRISPYLVLE